jgi:hypothetical protein
MTDTIEPTEEQKQAARLHFYPADDHIDDATTLALARLLAEREHRLREELSGLDALDATMSDLVERASLESDMIAAASANARKKRGMK